MRAEFDGQDYALYLNKDTQELQREFESHDRSLMDEIKSMISIITG